MAANVAERELIAIELFPPTFHVVFDVSREGIIFPAGDKRAERYWRLDHPLSLLKKLQDFNTWLYSLLSFSPLEKLQIVRIWLYGGPSLSLSAKFQWLVAGPSPQPWSKRSRWIRWPIYGLFCTLLLAPVIVWNTIEQVPLTGRWRIKLFSNRTYERILKKWRESGLESLGFLTTKVKPLAEPELSRVNDIIERVLLTCGLENAVRQLYFIDNPDKPQASISPLFHIFLRSKLLKLMTSEDELAAVLSHEMSHLLADHSRETASILVIQGLMTAPLLAMFLGAFWAPRLLLTALTSIAANTLVLRHQERCMEKEADYMGMLLMAEAGFNPEAVEAVWTKLAAFKDIAGNTTRRRSNILSTHPSFNLRIKKCKEQLPKVLRLMGKDQSVGGPSSIPSKADEALELRWKDFLASNAQRQILMPWLEWTSGKASS
ncbi:MAG: hypothetical protein Q9195_007202 [Heterodermia aff. obscurata]